MNKLIMINNNLNDNDKYNDHFNNNEFYYITFCSYLVLC